MHRVRGICISTCAALTLTTLAWVTPAVADSAGARLIVRHSQNVWTFGPARPPLVRWCSNSAVTERALRAGRWTCSPVATTSSGTSTAGSVSTLPAGRPAMGQRCSSTTVMAGGTSSGSSTPPVATAISSPATAANASAYRAPGTTTGYNSCSTPARTASTNNGSSARSPPITWSSGTAENAWTCGMAGPIRVRRYSNLDAIRRIRRYGGQPCWKVVTTRHSGMCLTVQNWWQDDGVQLKQYTCNGGTHQQWFAQPYCGLLPPGIGCLI
jgi:hypothetical protein